MEIRLNDEVGAQLNALMGQMGDCLLKSALAMASAEAAKSTEEREKLAQIAVAEANLAQTRFDEMMALLEKTMREIATEAPVEAGFDPDRYIDTLRKGQAHMANAVAGQCERASKLLESIRGTRGTIGKA